MLGFAELCLARENFDGALPVKFEIWEMPETAVIIEERLFRGIFFGSDFFICSMSRNG